MSDSPIPFDSKPPEARIFKAQDRKSQAVFRGTYSPANANKWRPLYESMMADNQNKVVTSEATGYSPNTLYLQAQDAKKWLAEVNVSPEEREKWTMFAGRISIGRRPYGIEIYWKPTMVVMASSSVPNMPHHIVATNNLNKDWKDEFETWLQTAQPGDIWTKENVFVDDEKALWLRRTMASLGGDTEVEITTTSVRVMR